MSDLSSHSSQLDPRRKHAVLVSASLVSRRGQGLANDFRRALNEALSPAQLSELILQSLLFDGYPCALEGLITLRELLGVLPAEDGFLEEYSPDNVALWRRRGDDLCRRIYGANFEPLLRNVEALSPTLREWMLIEGYGRVLGRPALDIDLRELGIIAILTVKNLPRQLHSHLRGALHVGVPAEELQAAIHLCRPFTKAVNVRSALQVWRKVARNQP